MLTNAKCFFFVVFLIYQKENAWTKKQPDIKILPCINEITQAEYQAAKQNNPGFKEK